uniref:Kinesin-like protein n=1 Tax=Skeletonema marinoi TaxID=267567 RepID=A0A7S2PMK1_9STRA|mmetsp:Transcript_2550/g.4103  ORF Transcript_2550/g.4103 Transcript_2550/m.4103 type:complete len:1177 (+) Transcript_2550:205-3735(+)
MSSSETTDLVQTWLADAGLHHAVDNFRMAGIDSPRSLVQLELSHFEMLGVTQPEDRKKLFFLMQRVKKALTEETAAVIAPPTASAAAAAVVQEREDHYSEDFSVETKSQPRTEFGMSVETSSMKEPISPVTLSSPLVMEDNAFDVGGVSSSSDNNNTRNYMEQMLKQRATQRHQKDNDAKVSSSQVAAATATTFPSSRQSLMNRYHRDVDDGKLSSASDNRSYLESGGTDTSSYDATVSSKQRKNRRKSGIPMMKSRPHPRLSVSSTITAEKDLIDELDECLKSPLRDELDDYDDAATSTTKSLAPSVDVRARRTSIHSRPTIKKTNQSRPRRLSGIPAPPSMDSKDDDESIMSETSDLSTSLHSYSSLSSSVSSNNRVRSKKNSRASTGTYSSRSSLSSSLGRLDENQHRNGVKGARATDKTSSTAISRIGKKRLSTIPSSRIAPTSPLTSLTSTQLDESITSHSGLPQLKKNVALNRRKSLGGKVSSSRPTTADSASTAKSITSSASKRKPKKMTTPRTQRGTPRSVSPGMSTLTNRPLSPMRTVSRSRATTPREKRPLSPMKTSSRARATTPPRATSPLNRSRVGKAKSPNSGAVFIHGVPEDTSWATQISHFREAANEEHNDFISDQKSQSSDADYEMRIRVIVRKRPMSKREAAQRGDVDVIHPLDYDDHGQVLVYQPKTKLDLTKEVEVAKFAFDNVYDETSNNLDIYNTSVKNLIPGVFHGKWASVFAYGQTGSGKTFTMMGSGMTGMKAGNQAENLSDANLGLYFLAAQDVFQLAEDPQYADISINCSLFEIYGGKLLDLLNDRNPIRCLEDSKGKVCFPGLSEHPVSDPMELMDIIEAGSLNRSTGQTQANADSSRSHAVLQLSLRKDVGRSRRNIECGRLTFIDLAGSERGADTANTCRTTRMEGAEINKSLLALKEVIRALATGDSMKRIPFRGSKLTQVLKEGFVGKSSRTVMVTCVAPNMNNCDHTLNTLRYADRVKERDAETGKLSAAVAANSTIKMDKSLVKPPKLPPRPLTAPAKSFRIDKDDSSDEEEVPPPPSPNFESDESASFDMIEDSDSITLTQSPTANDQRSPPIASPTEPERPNRRVEAATLIETHKSVQASMLKILKREVALVNKPETTDLAAIERYFHELDSISHEQVTLLTTLKTALQSYFEVDNSDRTS